MHCHMTPEHTRPARRCRDSMGRVAFVTDAGTGDSELKVRAARRDDVAEIVAMLADDALGATRETPGEPERYLAAFEVIDADPHQFLAVAVRDGEVVGTFQLTFIAGLSRRGAVRAQLEAVRVHSSARGSGLGRQLIGWAIAEARRRGAVLIQLTSDASRTDAHRFYEGLGFEASHTGFKLALSVTP